MLLVMDVYGLYNYAVTNFGNILWLDTVTWYALSWTLVDAFDDIDLNYARSPGI